MKHGTKLYTQRFIFLFSVGSYGPVTTMVLIHPQFSLIISINCNSFKITIGLIVKSLSGLILLRKLS
jgi:hypothetical protein